MITADMDCPRCGTVTPCRRIQRETTEDSVIEVWECANECGHREAL